jgi:hypothetical protein
MPNGIGGLVSNTLKVVETFGKCPDKMGDPSGAFLAMSRYVLIGCVKMKYP